MSLNKLTEIYDSKGMDGLSRIDRQKSGYNRGDFLFEKYLKQKTDRKEKPKIQITHEHIIELGAKTFNKFRASTPTNSDETPKKYQKLLQEEIERIETEADEFRFQLEMIFQKQLTKERSLAKKNYEELLERIEKQRDDLEEERIKEIIRKMNRECDIALKNQWKDAEDLRRKTLDELREIARNTIADEMEDLRKKSVKEALEKSEAQFKIRELEAISATRSQCEKEMNDKLKELRGRNELAEEALLKNIKYLEEKLADETTKRMTLESDFRLLQADYKRFMNYTDHYNSDYMMKLRHIGNQVLEDREFEDKLNDKLEKIDRKLNDITSKNEKLFIKN